MRRAIAILGCVAMGCSLITSLDDLADGGDASCTTCDGGADVLSDDCVLSVSPTLARAVAGSSIPITVNVKRSAQFTQPVSIALNNLPTNVTNAPLSISGSSGSFNLSVASQVAPMAVDLEVVATNVSCTPATFTLAVPGVISSTRSSTTVKVPQTTYLTSLQFALWGGGGGGNVTGDSCAYGGAGGSGGYALTDLDVVPGETLSLVVGTGGAPGGGGGGCTEVTRGNTILLLASGGGGGGAAGRKVQGSCVVYFSGGAGGAAATLGGYGVGDQTTTPGNGGGPGTATSGGAGGTLDGSAGASLEGGVGAGGSILGGPGGAPGGGHGEVGGGGGCGSFGGGGGGMGVVVATDNGGAGGGGGGSPFGPDGGTFVSGNGATAPKNQDANYVADASVGGIGGGPNGTGQIPARGGDGIAVVLIP